MAKKKEASVRHEEQTAAEYYQLNKKAVEDLVTADESNSPPVSEEELLKYQSGPKLKLSVWLKIVLIKAWFAASTFYFFVIGLGVYLHPTDLSVIAGIGLGFVIDILLNNLLRFMEKTPGGNDRWILVNVKGFMSLPLNILYGLLLMFCVMQTYHMINVVINALTGAVPLTDGSMPVPLGAEPISFGVLAMAWDGLFLLMKRTFRSIVADARASAKR